MNKRCRLLLTAKCPNNCPLCCNKQFDLMKEVPVIDRWDYNEFILTGGEPLQFSNLVIKAIQDISSITNFMGLSPKFYLYTSICKPSIWNEVLPYLDGVTYTVHTLDNAKELIQLIHVLNNVENGYESVFPHINYVTFKSLWLNLFPEAISFIEAELAKSPYKWDDVSRYFKIRQMEWKENCPIPEGEDFRRINILW